MEARRNSYAYKFVLFSEIVVYLGFLKSHYSEKKKKKYICNVFENRKECDFFLRYRISLDYIEKTGLSDSVNH